jgi:hypothetical protein
MAKGQKRSNKEAKKPKTAEKKGAGPRYLATAGLAPLGKAAPPPANRKK